MLTLLDKIRIRLHKFDSSRVTNAKLRGLSRQEAMYFCEREMHALLDKYISGEINGYQCRVFLNDFIRDSIPLKDEVELIQRHERNIRVATLERLGAIEENEFEHSLLAIVTSYRNRELTLMSAKARLEHIIWSFPEEEKVRWRRNFLDLCTYRR